MADDDLQMQPLENGIDFLESAIESLGDDSPRGLKYAIIHLQAAAEVLLKVRLMREHWTLVFRDSGTAKMDKFKMGDFISVGLGEALDRLKGVCGIALGDAHADLVRLGKERNKIQHFGFEGNKFAVQSIAAKALDGLLTFVNEHLSPGAPEEEVEDLTRLGEIIVEALQSLDPLIRARMKRLQSQLNGLAPQIVTCPRCEQSALNFSEPLTCLYCEKAWSVDDATLVAAEYTENILSLSKYSVYKDGGDWPVDWCPDCSQESLVYGVTFRDDPTAPLFACFGCQVTYKPGDVSRCGQCNEIMTGDDDMWLCSDCFDDRVSKD